MIVRSARFSYKVAFTNDFQRKLKSVLTEGDFLLIDENVLRLYAARLHPVLGLYRHLVLSPSERLKSYSGVGPVIEHLIRSGFRRSDTLVAIGGGIIQDVTSFVASVLYRGVKWIFVPTNLLTQCDSCIGSKTSINFESFKNQLGGFHPPRLIISDQSFLETLSQDELRSGMGEMMHYFFISGRKDFEMIRSTYAEAFRSPSAMRGLIQRSLEIKRSVIEEDEFDEGPRRVFNYGHTFGHALESYTDFAIPHGIAVSFGMDVANWTSVALGFLSSEEAEKLRVILEKNWMPTIPPPLELDRYLEILGRDKKNVGNEIGVILTRGLGQMFSTRIKANPELRETLQWCFDYYRRSKVGLQS